MLLCVSPAHGALLAEPVTVEVSVDGLVYFGAEAGSPMFTYTPPPSFDATVESITPRQIGADLGQNLTVVGTGYPDVSLLAPGFPLCRLSFS